MKNIIYTYRYMWKVNGSDSINFKIVSDVSGGLSLFEKALSEIPDLESAGKEYLMEYDVSQLGIFTPLFKGEESK